MYLATPMMNVFMQLNRFSFHRVAVSAAQRGRHEKTRLENSRQALSWRAYPVTRSHAWRKTATAQSHTIYAPWFHFRIVDIFECRSDLEHLSLPVSF